MITVTRKQPSRSTLTAAIFMLLAMAQSAQAHPGGHDRIMTLSEQIAHEPGNAQLLIKRAQERIEEDRDYTLAKTDLDRARELGANAATSHEYNFVLGLWHQYQENHAAAVQDFSRCIALDPHHLQCHRGLAEAHLGQQQTTEAIQAMQRFVDNSHSAQPDDYFHLAQRLEKTAKPLDALHYLDKAQATFGTLPHFEKYAITLEINQQRYQQALQRHQLLKPYFGKTAQWQYQQGQLFQNLDDKAQARAAFKQALATLQAQQQRKHNNSNADDLLAEDIRARLAALN